MVWELRKIGRFLLVGAGAIGLAFIGSTDARAENLQQIQAQIEAMQAQIRALQKQVQEAQAEAAAAKTAASSSSDSSLDLKENGRERQSSQVRTENSR